MLFVSSNIIIVYDWKYMQAHMYHATVADISFVKS